MARRGRVFASIEAMSVQGDLADFVASASPEWGGDEVWQRFRLALLDTLAVSIAAARDPALIAALSYLDRFGGPGACGSTWVTPGGAGRDAYVLVAGTSAHALDYDDVAPSWRGHPSAVLLPALAAVAAAFGSSGTDVARAYAIGFEVGARIGQACTGRHYELGWHATATIGTLAAAAGCARLAGLSRSVVSHALGLAVTQAHGVQASFGTSAKAVHAGLAAAAAVRSVELAVSGIDAAPDALDSAKGFAGLMAGGPLDTRAVLGLGSEPPAMIHPGIETKLYPTCYAAHRAIEAALEIRERSRPAFDAIESVDVEGSAGSHAPLLQRLPTNATEARFSVEYAVACALVEGHVGLASFERAPDAKGEIASLMARVLVHETDGPAVPRTSTVRVRIRTGETLQATVSGLRGDAHGSTGERALLAKASDCLRSVRLAHDPREIDDAILAVRAQPFASLFEGGIIDRIRRELWPATDTKRAVR